MYYEASCKMCGLLGGAGIEQNAMNLAYNHTNSLRSHICTIRDSEGNMRAHFKANAGTHVPAEAWV